MGTATRVRVTDEVRAWLKQYCESEPDTSSSVLQTEIQEQFGVEVTRRHINNVRAELGVRRPKKNAEPIEVEWRESAGSLLLLAGAEETGLLPELVEAVPTDTECERLAQGTVESQQQLMQTLLFLGIAGLQRPWELRSYTGDGLALLTGRERAFGYVHTERSPSACHNWPRPTAMSHSQTQWHSGATSSGSRMRRGSTT